MFRQEAIDGRLQIDNALEDATLQAALGENSEKALDSIQPRGRSRREVKCKAWMPGEPLDDFRVLMRGIIIEDHMDDLAGRESHQGYKCLDRR